MLFNYLYGVLSLRLTLNSGSSDFSTSSTVLGQKSNVISIEKKMLFNSCQFVNKVHVLVQYFFVQPAISTHLLNVLPKSFDLMTIIPLGNKNMNLSESTKKIQRTHY